MTGKDARGLVRVHHVCGHTREWTAVDGETPEATAVRLGAHPCYPGCTSPSSFAGAAAREDDYRDRMAAHGLGWTDAKRQTALAGEVVVRDLRARVARLEALLREARSLLNGDHIDDALAKEIESGSRAALDDTVSRLETFIAHADAALSGAPDPRPVSERATLTVEKVMQKACAIRAGAQEIERTLCGPIGRGAFLTVMVANDELIQLCRDAEKAVGG